MTKQEEIVLGNELRFTRLAGHIIGDNLDKSPIEIGNMIVREFHSQGVGIKVERELPEIVFPMHIGSDSPIGLVAREWHKRTQKDMLDAGYEVVEPLI